MTYDTENERFVFDLTDCETGEYTYYYTVNGEPFANPFNDVTNEDKANIIEEYGRRSSIEKSDPTG